MSSRWAGLRVLWADDQPEAVDALRPYLGLETPTITTAATATDAEGLIRQVGFDLCLLDLQMPPGNWGGLDLLRALGSLTQTIPIVVLSGAGTLRECIEAQRLGARAYLQKEQAAEELGGIVRAVLAKVESDQPAGDYSRVTALEKAIHSLVIGALRLEAERRGCDMFVGLAPRKTALRTYERMLDQRAGKQEEFLDIVDCREILDDMWAVLPEVRPLEATLRPKNREARTSWLADLNELRKVVMHPTRGHLDAAGRDRLAKLEEIVSRWVAGLRS